MSDVGVASFKTFDDGLPAGAWWANQIAVCMASVHVGTRQETIV